MANDLIPTFCENCRYAGFLRERGRCPQCGAGPAQPSPERVELIYGLPVITQADPIGLITAWGTTRPAKQTIIAAGGSGGRPSSASVRPHAPADIVPSKPRQVRAKAISDPMTSFRGAVIALRTSDRRLTQTAVAAEMGIDRGTLASYIKHGLVPAPPWEGWS